MVTNLSSSHSLLIYKCNDSPFNSWSQYSARRGPSKGKKPRVSITPFFRRCSSETWNHKPFFLIYHSKPLLLRFQPQSKSCPVILYASIFYTLGLHVDNISLSFGFEQHVNIVCECLNMKLLKYFVSMIHKNTVVYLREWNTRDWETIADS